MADFTSNTSETGTSSLEFLIGKTVDTVLNYSPATLFFLGNQKRWQGTEMRFPIKHDTNTQGMWYDGLQRFSTTSTSNFVNMKFSPTGREINCVISGMEVDVNESNKVIDIIARRLASDAQDMASDIATSFYAVQSGLAFNSLTNICDDDTLTSSATYGGLTRSSYTADDSRGAIDGNYVAIGGNLTLANMATEYGICSHGADSPNLLLTTKTVWNYYEKLLTPTLSTQVVSMAMAGYPNFIGATAGGVPNIVAPGTPLKGGQGFSAIFYRGKPVIADEVCPSGYLYMLNTRSIGFYGLPSTMEGYKPVKFYSDTMDSVYNVPTTTGFSFSGFNMPVDQYGKVGHIILQGNLIGTNPRLNGVMITVTGA